MWGLLPIRQKHSLLHHIGLLDTYWQLPYWCSIWCNITILGDIRTILVTNMVTISHIGYVAQYQMLRVHHIGGGTILGSHMVTCRPQCCAPFSFLLQNARGLLSCIITTAPSCRCTIPRIGITCRSIDETSSKKIVQSDERSTIKKLYSRPDGPTIIIQSNA